MNYNYFYDLPVWVSGLIFILFMFAALEVGYRVAIKERDTWKNPEAGGGNAVQTALLALLGLILAFTMASGVNRNETRKQIIIHEANALGTAFLRADLMAEPGRTKLRQALLEYSRTRVFEQGEVISIEQREEIIQKTLQSQAKLWPITKQVMEQIQPDPIEALLVAAVNDVLDVHTNRVAAAFDNLPTAVLWMLVFIAMVSVGVGGFNAGISDRLSRGRQTALILVLASVLMVLMDLDRPNDGLIQVSQQSVYSAIAVMESDLGQ
jgi:hypothetical protein